MSYIVEKDGMEIEKNSLREIQPIYEKYGGSLWKRNYFKHNFGYKDELISGVENG